AHHDAGPSAQRPKVRRWPLWSWVLICLAAMSFGSFLAEGAATDWSAVYLHSSLGAPVGLAAVGFTVFSLTMTGGRLVGDRLAALAGPARLVRLSAGMAAGGFAAALLVAQVWSALAGFALLGAGLSVVVPLVFSAAAATGRPGPNLALVTSSGYLGVLAGPALIGGGGPPTPPPPAPGLPAVPRPRGAVPAARSAAAARPAPPRAPRARARGCSWGGGGADGAGPAGLSVRRGGQHRGNRRRRGDLDPQPRLPWQVRREQQPGRDRHALLEHDAQAGRRHHRRGNLHRPHAGDHQLQRDGWAAGERLDPCARRDPEPHPDLAPLRHDAQGTRGQRARGNLPAKKRPNPWRRDQRHGRGRQGYRGPEPHLRRRLERQPGRERKPQPGRGLQRQPRRDLDSEPRRGLQAQPRRGPGTHGPAGYGGPKGTRRNAAQPRRAVRPRHGRRRG